MDCTIRNGNLKDNPKCKLHLELYNPERKF